MREPTTTLSDRLRTFEAALRPDTRYRDLLHEAADQLDACVAQTPPPEIRIAELRGGEENDGPLESTDLYLDARSRGISLLISVPVGSEFYYSAYIDGVDSKGTVGCVAQTPRATTWQPIATAPTDGSYVLLLKPKWYHPPPVTISRWKDAGIVAGWDGYYGPEPTHWMPLHAAPVDLVVGEKG